MNMEILFSSRIKKTEDLDTESWHRGFSDLPVVIVDKKE